MFIFLDFFAEFNENCLTLHFHIVKHWNIVYMAPFWRYSFEKVYICKQIKFYVIHNMYIKYDCIVVTNYLELKTIKDYTKTIHFNISALIFELPI